MKVNSSSYSFSSVLRLLKFFSSLSEEGRGRGKYGSESSRERAGPKEGENEVDIRVDFRICEEDKGDKEEEEEEEDDNRDGLGGGERVDAFGGDETPAKKTEEKKSISVPLSPKTFSSPRSTQSSRDMDNWEGGEVSDIPPFDLNNLCFQKSGKKKKKKLEVIARRRILWFYDAKHQ